MPGAPGGFNPATGQMEGSPVHQMHQQPQGQYMGSQPMYGPGPASQGQYGQVIMSFTFLWQFDIFTGCKHTGEVGFVELKYAIFCRCFCCLGIYDDFIIKSFYI